MEKAFLCKDCMKELENYNPYLEEVEFVLVDHPYCDNTVNPDTGVFNVEIRQQQEEQTERGYHYDSYLDDLVAKTVEEILKANRTAMIEQLNIDDAIDRDDFQSYWYSKKKYSKAMREIEDKEALLKELLI